MMGRSSNLPFARAIPVALLLALAAPAAARADATLSVTGAAPHKTLTYTVDDALRHVMLAYVDGGNLVITDPQGIAVGASGCTIIDAKTADCGSVAGFELGRRAHHKLTLSITATITRPHSKLVRSAFTITVKTPAHKGR
jgi:hypothetical protein